MYRGKRLTASIGALLFVAVISLFIINLPRSYSAEGIWQGQFDINGRGPYDFTALYIDDKVVAVSEDANVVYRGEVSVEGAGYQSRMDMYIKNKNKFGEVTLTGTMPNAREIQARFETKEVNDRGDLHLGYRQDFEIGASPEKIAGLWILYHGFTTIKFKINLDGFVHGADTTGCAYDGLIKVIRPEVNAYSINLVTSSCNLFEGRLSGMAYLSSSVEENDTLNMHLFDDTWGLFMPIVRNDDTRLMDKNKQWKKIEVVPP